MKQFRASHNRTRKVSPFRSKYSSHGSQDSVEEQDATEADHLGSHLHPPKGMTRNYSQGHELDLLRQDLKDKLHPPQAVQAAWRSNPGSRNPSRHGSRITSSTLKRHAPTEKSLDELQDEESAPIMFHTVKSKTLPRNFASKKGSVSLDADDGTHLPSIHPPPASRGGGRHMTTDHLPTRTNGFKQNSGDIFNVSTDRSVDEILGEILRVASSVRMKESELYGHTLNCNWKGVRFGVNVHKQGAVCQVKFKWFSGGDLSSYRDLCEKFMRKLKLA